MSFTTEFTALKNAITGFINLMNANFSKNVTNAYVDIAGNGASAVYDLQTLLGANHALYDKKRVKVTTRVKDIIAGSPTLNMYINGESVIIIAVDAERYVRIFNQHTASLNVLISIDVPKL